MNPVYEIGIVNNDCYSNEALLSSITCLDRLDKICDDVFNVINNAITERKTKLEKLQSRIVRIFSIISLLKNQNQIINVKSLRYYPQKESDYYPTHSIFNKQNNNDNQENEEEKKLLKSINKINKNRNRPKRTLDDIYKINEALSQLEDYKDISNNYKEIIKEKNISPVLNYFTSAFQFEPKHNIIDSNEKKDYSIKEISFTKEAKAKNQKFKKRKLQEAPISIKEGSKIRQLNFDSQKKMMSIFKSEINFELPNSVNLGDIANIPTNNASNINQINTSNSIDDGASQFEGNNVVDDVNQENIDEDDKIEYQTPIDLIRFNKVNKGNQQQGLTTQNEISKQENKNNQINNVQEKQLIVNEKDIENNNNNHIDKENNIINEEPPKINSNGIPVPPPLPIKCVFENNENLNANALTIQEEIGDNPIAKLKKVGTIKVKTIDPKPQNLQTEMVRIKYNYIINRWKCSKNKYNYVTKIFISMKKVQIIQRILLFEKNIN